MLRAGGATRFIDSNPSESEVKTEESALQRLMIAPESWLMDTQERAIEFSEIIRHFTIFAPFEGRPFVRAWLEALTPCFSRWILLSNVRDSLEFTTLKNFFGAFGQPGIVVCLADKGASMLRVLKSAARSVEAISRGTVEKNYWKRITESICGGDPGWEQLARIKDRSLKSSQLEFVPEDWLMDASDWCQIFSNLVSPEISRRYEQNIIETFSENKEWIVKPGPPKTLARCLTKAREYWEEFRKEPNLPRWANFAKRFENVYQRKPSKPEDFVWNIVDFARCSITVPGAADAIKAKHIIEKRFPVVCVKNE